MKKVLVGMSGGVDSSVSVYLLQQQGYEVSGATLKLFDNEDIGILDKEKTCCSLSDVQDARNVAMKLGCRHYVFNYSQWFMEDVVKRFARSYEEGQTPNPCIDCNRYIKFSRMLERAKFLGFDYIATGHYAQIEQDPVSGRYLLKKGADPAKDQSYVLYTMTQEELSRTLFPLGKMTKQEIRRIAEQEGFVNAQKRDSQDICFVQDGDYGGFLEKVMGVSAEEGDFVDEEGRKIGRHRGLIHYTVGQRKGLGQTFGKPMYVLAKEKKGNTVTLGSNQDLFSPGMVVSEINWIAVEDLKSPMRVTVKARYSMKEVGAVLYPLANGRVQVVFDEKQRAITPGQAAVFYQGDLVVGGGTIAEAIPRNQDQLDLGPKGTGDLPDCGCQPFQDEEKEKTMDEYTMSLSETMAYEALKVLYIKNDLEVDPDLPMPEGVIKNWKITNQEDRLIAGLTLAKYEGEFIIDGIAVEPEYRKLKLGKVLLEKAIAEVRELGGTTIFLVARAPEFFRKQGFVTINDQDGPQVFDCLTCPQYRIQCHPEVMRLDLE